MEEIVKVVRTSVVWKQVGCVQVTILLFLSYFTCFDILDLWEPSCDFGRQFDPIGLDLEHEPTWVLESLFWAFWHGSLSEKKCQYLIEKRELWTCLGRRAALANPEP